MKEPSPSDGDTAGRVRAVDSWWCSPEQAGGSVYGDGVAVIGVALDKCHQAKRASGNETAVVLAGVVAVGE